MSKESRDDRNVAPREEKSSGADVGGLIKKILFALVVLTLVGFIVWAIVGGDDGDDEGDDGNIEFSEIEVKEAACELLSSSVLLNDIYFGCGMPATEDDKDDRGNYSPIDPLWAEVHGLKSIEDLRNLTRATFSESIYGDLERLFLTGATVDGVGYSHYIDGYGEEKEDKTRDHLGIFVHKNRESDFKVYATQSTSFDLDSLTVIGAEGKRVKIELDVTVTDSADGRTMKARRHLYLVREADGWRLDSHSKATLI